MEQEIVDFCCMYPYVFLTGDTNAHTATLPDFIEADQFLPDYFDFDSELLNYFDAYKNLSEVKLPLIRSSKDDKKNQVGYKLLDMCINNKLFIGQDAQLGKYTFRETSVIDYNISSVELLKYIQDFKIIALDSLFYA